MSTYDQMVQMHATKAMQDPGWAQLLVEVCQKLNAGTYNQWFVDCLTQHWTGIKQGYDLFDAYVFAEFWGDLLHGDIAYAVIGVSKPPGRDRDRVKNNSILATLPPPFRAEFFGGRGDDDGDFRWDTEITLTTTRLDEHNQQVSGQTMLEPGCAPLEVGTTMPGRTLAHLRTEGVVARWPYNHDRIGLFVQMSIPKDAPFEQVPDGHLF
jgi:hypothetical protein